MGIGLSRAIRDLKRPRDPQPSSVRSLLVHAAVCHLLGMAHKQPVAEVAARHYGGSPRVLDAIASPGAVMARAAFPPATTTSVGWAGELVGVGTYGAVTALAPTSVYARLAARGLRISLAGNGSVSIRSRLRPPM